MSGKVATIVASSVMEQFSDAITLEGGNDTTKAFFKAYTQVSPKIKKAKSKEHLALIEEATSAMNKLSKALGARKDGKKAKKGGFTTSSTPQRKNAQRVRRLPATI